MDFLHGKASNFRSMLNANTEEQKALVASYNETELETLIHRHLLPLYLVGQLDVAVAKVQEAFPDVDASKVKRYFSCFCECVLRVS